MLTTRDPYLTSTRRPSAGHRTGRVDLYTSGEPRPQGTAGELRRS